MSEEIHRCRACGARATIKVEALGAEPVDTAWGRMPIGAWHYYCEAHVQDGSRELARRGAVVKWFQEPTAGASDGERLARLETLVDKLEQLTTGRLIGYSHYGSLAERIVRLEGRVLSERELKDEEERLERVRQYRQARERG